MAKQQPTHIEVFFIRSTRVRRDAIPGETVGEMHDPMKIVKRGEKLRLHRPVALDLITGQSAIEVTTANREAIEQYLEDFKREDADLERRKNRERNPVTQTPIKKAA